MMAAGKEAQITQSVAHPVFRPMGEAVLMAEFGTLIADDVHDRVLALDAALTAQPFEGFLEAVPAYASLMVVFDPLLTDHDLAADALAALARQPASARSAPRQHEVEVCYGGEYGPDLEAVAQAAGMSVEEVIALHGSVGYKVYLYGFAPGYAYLAGVPQALQLPRKPAPVRGIAAGSVIIAGPQCLVQTLDMPTGWWVIGRSPTKILTGDSARPFLFDVGDEVRFRPVTPARYEEVAT